VPADARLNTSLTWSDGSPVVSVASEKDSTRIPEEKCCAGGLPNVLIAPDKVVKELPKLPIHRLKDPEPHKK
jgi:hypothetical protein